MKKAITTWKKGNKKGETEIEKQETMKKQKSNKPCISPPLKLEIACSLLITFPSIKTFSIPFSLKKSPTLWRNVENCEKIKIFAFFVSSSGLYNNLEKLKREKEDRKDTRRQKEKKEKGRRRKGKKEKQPKEIQEKKRKKRTGKRTTKEEKKRIEEEEGFFKGPNRK